MVGHGGSSAGSYLADPTSPIPSHCASIVATSTLRVNNIIVDRSFSVSHMLSHTASRVIWPCPVTLSHHVILAVPRPLFMPRQLLHNRLIYCALEFLFSTLMQVTVKSHLQRGMVYFCNKIPFIEVYVSNNMLFIYKKFLQ